MNLSIVLMLAIVTKTLVEYLTKPIYKLLSTPKPERDGVFVLSLITPYVSFTAGLLVGIFARVDLFAVYLPDAPEALSLGLTAALIGGGASLIFDVVSSIKEWSGKIGAHLPVPPLPPVIMDRVVKVPL